MNIREAIPVDAEEIANIHIAAWQFAYRGIMDDALLNSMDHAKKVAAWADAIENLGWSIYVSQHDGKITGFVHISEYRDNDIDNCDFGEVASLYVCPELVGTGLGGRLFSEGLNRLESQGFTKVALWVLEQNERAISFYEKFGFRRDGASKTHPKTGLAEVRYVR
jgi:ribosomal protein S18 acetylase RimI-like enzyme